MKKAIPYVVAVLLFVIGLVLASPGAKTKIVVAARSLPAGYTLQAGDVETVEISQEQASQKGAYSDPKEVVGKVLRVPRVAGDPITAGVLGGVPDLSARLKPNERLVAVKVSLSSGLAGLLKEGDTVGVTMVYEGAGHVPYAKAVLEGLRVVYVSPAFQAKPESQPVASAAASKSALGGGSSAALGGLPSSQAHTGVVALAVPVQTQAVVYDFGAEGGDPQTRYVNAVELLSALDQTSAKLSLYLTPEKAQPLTTSGLFLPELVITPPPTPTPTPYAAGGR